jgi:glycosyltransferase involved in cell wall biosynthesis
LSERISILFIGPYPPPSGGVSIHIFRLIKLIEHDFDVDVVDESRLAKKDVFNLRSLKLFKYCAKIMKADVVHIHSGTRGLRYFHILMAKISRKPCILTLHSCRQPGIKIVNSIDRFFYALPDYTIVVAKSLTKCVGNKANIIIKPAFIPPDISIEVPLPSQVSDWLLRKKQEGSIVISGNASRLNRFNNEDLYGLDLILEAARRFKSEGVNAGFVFVISSTNGDISISEYQQYIERHQLSDNVLLILSSVSFPNLILQSDIIVRPTNTDGDALTIREALFFNKPTVASDVTGRPAGTILFKNRNLDSFINELKCAMEDINKKENIQQSYSDYNSYSSFYKDMYMKSCGYAESISEK